MIWYDLRMEMVTCQRVTFSSERATVCCQYPEGHHVTSAVFLSARRAGLEVAISQSTKTRNNKEALDLFEGEWMTFSPWIIRFRTCLTEDGRPRAFGPLAGEFWYCLHVFDLR